MTGSCQMMSKASNKVCGVCGDRASGYNFNAISCESCKAFFRRNALKENKLKCFFDNNCQIDVTTRKFCQHCRLQKCFIIGMKKQLILSDEEKQLIKNKIKENKQKRLKILNESSNSCDSQSVCSQFLNLNKHLRNLIASPLTPQPCMINEPNQQSLSFANHCSQQFPNYETNPLKHVLSFENFNNIYRSEADHHFRGFASAGDVRLETCATFTKSHQDSVSGLNSVEVNRINELSVAFTKVKSEPIRFNAENCQYTDIIELTNLAVRRVIDMTKKVECYKSLCQADQQALMKAACTQMIMLRSIVNWNEDKQYWTIVKDNENSGYFKLNILKQCLIPRIYELHKKFMSCLAREWDHDLHILNLLSVIVLFNPNTSDVQHKHLIEYERHSHKYLLQRYLDMKYGTKCLANQKFFRLINVLEDLHVLNEENIRLYLQSDHDAIGPLLIDLFDLQN